MEINRGTSQQRRARSAIKVKTDRRHPARRRSFGGRSTERQHNMCSTGEPEDKRSCCPRRGFVGAHHLVRSPNGVIILERVNPLQKERRARMTTITQDEGEREGGGQIVEGVTLSERETERRAEGKKYSIVRRRRRGAQIQTLQWVTTDESPKMLSLLPRSGLQKDYRDASGYLSRDFGDSAEIPWT